MMYRVSKFMQHFAIALLAGIGVATLWVNASPGSYYDVTEWRMVDTALPGWLASGEVRLTLGTLVSNGLMALFLFILGKEFWESITQERGPLRERNFTGTLLMTAGGMIGAALVWLVLSSLFQTAEEAERFGGWTVPLGSDVVLCYFVGRLVFGAGHPALHVLLMAVITMDIATLLILGVFFTPGSLALIWLVLPLVAAFGVWALVARRAAVTHRETDRRRAFHLWPYLIAGAVSFAGVAASGLPPALGLLPIIPAMPRADHAFGLFAEAEEFLSDPLNRLAHLAVRPVIVVLFLFGLTHGGIDLSAAAPTTAILLGALWLGKPAGMLVAGWVVAPRLGLRRPGGLRRRDLGLVAGIAGMGFTLPVLAVESTLPGGAMQEAARLGLAISLCAGPSALVLRTRLGMKQRRS